MMVGRNLVGELEARESTQYPQASQPHSNGGFRVVLVDAGAKEHIIRDLVQREAVVTVVPYDANASSVLSLEPDGVMISNGPGDPAVLDRTIRLIRALFERHIPLAGICLGHQLVGLALGGQTYKMCFGHRGVNHPVKDLITGRVLVTTQNHGFAVDPTSLGVAWEPLDTAFRPVRPEILHERGATGAPDSSPTMAELLPSGPLVGASPLGFGPVELTHLSLNDGTLEGLRLPHSPVLSVQFHPEASPGPHDAKGFFDEFIAVMEGKRA